MEVDVLNVRMSKSCTQSVLLGHLTQHYLCHYLLMSEFSSQSIHTKQTPWPESASELYRPSDRRLSAKLVQTFADRGCHVVSVTDLYLRIPGFLDRSRYFFFQVAPQLYSTRLSGPCHRDTQSEFQRCGSPPFNVEERPNLSLQCALAMEGRKPAIQLCTPI
jgi:hypothetical protein